MAIDYDLSLIVDSAVTTILTVQRQIFRDILEDPDWAFTRMQITRSGKELLAIDWKAEELTKKLIRKFLKAYEPLHLYGEESLADPDLSLADKQGVVVLMDMVDGTDLLERGLSNWCSAVVFYAPQEKRILASFVGIPNDAVYYATADTRGAFKHPVAVKGKKGSSTRLHGPSRTPSLAGASIAFYGQKIDNFLSVAEHPKFCAALKKLASRGKRTKKDTWTRLYNLAGNPFMVRMVDGYAKTAGAKLDAIFDLRGQAPHDVVPGAYIATSAGAVLRSLDNGDPVDLVNALARPADPAHSIKYVLAGTESLATELHKIFKSESAQSRRA